MRNFKTKLKNLSDSDFEKYTKLAELDKEEYWIIYYGIIKNRMVKNTCQKLSISQSTYFRKLLTAKIKLYYTMKFN